MQTSWRGANILRDEGATIHVFFIFLYFKNIFIYYFIIYINLVFFSKFENYVLFSLLFLILFYLVFFSPLYLFSSYLLFISIFTLNLSSFSR